LLAFFEAANKEVNMANIKDKVINEVVLHNANGVAVISNILKI
jgi:lipid-binding SYLF domain-containing protein|tara:strand:- start:679 stop:807 length:129 start_codon:yes stop_codon:yes gene_type:complete